MSDSDELWRRAREVIPGGVNSPVRAFRSVGRDPLFVARAEGAHVYDREGRAYIDFIGGWGPHILGHRHPAVLQAIESALTEGFAYGLATEHEVELAEFLCRHLPHLEMVRLTNSGTEATMTAIRLARGFTGRDLILKFDGHYHGHPDALLMDAGSGAATFGVPSSAGIPAGVSRDTLVARYNDLASVQRVLEDHRDQVAAIIIEPVMGNMGCIPPAEGFLAGVRALCDHHGCLLIIDEVMTGFRVAFGGAVARYGVRPDLATYGKIIGGGLPVGAFGGRRDVMSRISPLGPVYQGGTFAGHTLSVAAGLAMLTVLRDTDPYPVLESRMKRLIEGMLALAKEHSIPAFGTQVGAMAGFFFQSGPVRNAEDALHCDLARFTRYHAALMEAGVLMPPSQYESFFIGTAHDDDVIGRMLDAVGKAFESEK